MSRQVEHIPILDFLISATSGSLSATLNEADLQHLLSEIQKTRSVPIKKIGLNQGFIDIELFRFSIKKLSIAFDRIEIGKNKLILHTRILNINSLILKVLTPIIRTFSPDIHTNGQETALDISSLFAEKTRFLPETVLLKLDDTSAAISVDDNQLTIVLNIYK